MVLGCTEGPKQWQSIPSKKSGKKEEVARERTREGGAPVINERLKSWQGRTVQPR